MRHTSGPWEFGRYGVHDFEVLGGEGGRSRVAVLRGVIRSTEYDAKAEKRVPVEEPVPEAWANAALISAAPDLYQAASLAVACFDNHGVVDAQSIADLRAALARAHGEPSPVPRNEEG